MSTSQYLQRPAGRIAYDVTGTGPLVVCVPGMGDIRSTFRFLAPALAAAGHRVATMDLRGHGDSDATFATYDDDALAADVAALLDHLGEPATIVGNSMGAASAVLVAARRPELVRGLALLGPFVRNPKSNPLMSALMRVLLAPAWARLTWAAYLPKLYAGRRPADFDQHRAGIDTALRRPGAGRAFSRTTRSSHDQAEAAAPSVTAPAVVLMGEQDPDFADPAAEARWVATTLGGPAEVVMLPDCGHYPQAQQPELAAAAVLDLMRRVPADA